MSKLTIKSRYATTPNHILNDETLTFKAKGIFGFIQSKPGGWSFSAKKISLQTKDGLDSVKAGIRELEKKGLLTRKKYKNAKGQWEWEYILMENPPVENTSMETPSMENPSNISKQDKVNKISKQDKEKEYTEETSDDKKQQNKDIGQIIKWFEEKKVNAAASMWYEQKTQREACRLLLKQFDMPTIEKAISILPATNKRPRYEFPLVKTPNQLLENWHAIEGMMDSKLKEMSKPKMI